MAPTVELLEDHLRLGFTGLSAFLHVRRSIVVPYSTIDHAEAGDVSWPGLFEGGRLGTHVPGVVARGTFTTWSGRRRFFSVAHKSARVVRIHLKGHPQFDQLILDVPDTDLLVQQILAHKGRN